VERPQAGQIGHTCIRVNDIDASVRFYNGLLGMPIVERRDPAPPGTRVAALGSPANYLEIFELKPGQEAEERGGGANLRLNHFCLWVEGIENLEKRAAEAGSPFLRPIGSSPNWIGAAIKVGWLLDPDGNRVELLEWTGPGQA
jgi:catechol 2,3-dioxygenase-like lactoylglutathione lyase family enzyme